MKTHVILNWLVCSFLMISLGSCGGDHGDGGAVYPTTSVTFSVGGASDAAGAKAPFLSTFADVTRVTVVISGKDKYGVDQDPLTTVELTKGPDGVWSALVPDLPVGPALTFTAHGYDASNEEIFSGVTVQILTGSADTVVITMSPVSSGGEILFPIISGITVPSEIVVSTDAAVSIVVTGSPNENLAYAVTSGGGAFNPATGTIALPSSANGTINTTYTAPASPGTLTHTVKLTNSQGNSVESDFSTNIVYSQTTATVTVGFAPVVTALSAKRTGNQVSWTVTVSDDKALSLLSFAWSFSQTAGTTGAAFSTADANPGVLSGYDQTVAGTITLTVTDGDVLSTTISFALSAGQFPDSGAALTDEEAIDAVWQRVTDSLATYPTQTEFIAVFDPVMAADFLENGENKESALNDMSSNPQGGLTITSTITKAILPAPAGYDKGYEIRLVMTKDAMTNTMNTQMVYDGVDWLWYGNHAWIEYHEHPFASMTVSISGTVSFYTGLYVAMYDKTYNNAACTVKKYAYCNGARSAIVTGPGLPASGVVLEHTYPGDSFKLYNVTDNGGIYIMSDDAAILAIPDNSVYTISLYAETADVVSLSNTPLTSGTVTNAKRPLANSELSAARFPGLTSPSSHAIADAAIPGILNVTWTMPADIFGRDIDLEWTGGGSSHSVGTDVSEGQTTATLDTTGLPAPDANTMTRLNFESRDIYGREYSLDWQFK